jgi:hypothetical protein
MILCGMLDLCRPIFGIFVDLFRPRAATEVEILVLRQQIIVVLSENLIRTGFTCPERIVAL